MNNFILEWTTSLDSSSGTLICPSLCPRHVGRNNYVPLFGVDTVLRYYVIRDVIVPLDYIRVLAGYPASLETLSPGLSPPPSLVPLSLLSYSSLPSTLPPSNYPASLRITAFPRYFLTLKLSYFDIFAPNPPPPRRMGWGGGYMFWLFFRQNFFYRFSRQFVKFPVLLKF